MGLEMYDTWTPQQKTDWLLDQCESGLDVLVNFIKNNKTNWNHMKSDLTDEEVIEGLPFFEAFLSSTASMVSHIVGIPPEEHSQN